MEPKEFNLYMGGKPCKPGKSRKFSPAGAKKLTEYINGIRFQGRIINKEEFDFNMEHIYYCLLYTSPSPRDRQKSRMPSSA